ncbi:class I SAM-dependent methyltransferase [Kluyvera intermedia]|uniref:class I SAM-dependent methyltransferase n=1 Tax=Kluyvera intermedia TaxID=61648 RepID=UPI001F1F0675|nr:class I SAM-dependent methyltransferase [Kluyvera intermedia]EKU4732411.1 class I SAM-dependent methyltransferase [Kluyvera ascorbata]MCE9890602.1 class I SAM-dependent methyltransferase [Kluyvera intermedia]
MSNHHEALVKSQFSGQATAYLQSSVHAQGADLRRLSEWLADDNSAELLDVGCGAGHASFTAAPLVAAVTAYDLSEGMLAVVSQEAEKRGFSNIRCAQGPAEVLPFADNSFDIVISRYSAHHWHDIQAALMEIRRVLKPGGRFIMMDIASPGKAMLDVWLQTVEMLRDPSHIHNYSQGQWLAMVNNRGMVVEKLVGDKLPLEFSSWVARMKTPENIIEAIRYLQTKVSDDVRTHFAIGEDGSFVSDTIMFQAR